MYIRILKVPLSSILSLISSEADARSKVGFHFVYILYKYYFNIYEKELNQKFHKK